MITSLSSVYPGRHSLCALNKGTEPGVEEMMLGQGLEEKQEDTRWLCVCMCTESGTEKTMREGPATVAGEEGAEAVSLAAA